MTAKPLTQWEKAKVIGFFVIFFFFVVLAIIVLGSRDDGPSPRSTSLREKCEQRWNENKGFAQSPYMDHELYVKNCLKTYEQMQNGEFPRPTN